MKKLSAKNTKKNISPKVNQAEGILAGFVTEREEIMQKMQPSVHPSKVAQPSVRRPNKQKAAKEQPPAQDNATGGGPPPPPPPGGSGGGPPPPPFPSCGVHAGPPERENSGFLPPPPIMTTSPSDTDFDYYESQVSVESEESQVVLHLNDGVHVVEPNSFISNRITQ